MESEITWILSAHMTHSMLKSTFMTFDVPEQYWRKHYAKLVTEILYDEVITSFVVPLPTLPQCHKTDLIHEEC